MTGHRLLAAAAALTLAGAASGAAAQDGARDSGGGIVSEVRVGVFQHDIDLFVASYEDGQALNAEILFRSPFPRGETWSFRPHLGTTIALEGETDQIYAGLTLTVQPFDGAFSPLWFSAFGGGAVHDGKLDTDDPDAKSLGSPVLFHFGGEIGWDATEHLSVSMYYAHMSNAWLADENDGMEHGGVRIGWRF